MNIFIIGSCVSRDAFTFAENDHTIVEYVARNSFGTAFRNEKFPLGVEDLDPTNVVTSAWQRRMMDYDVSRRIPELLGEKKDQCDAVLIDFIDERFQIVVSDGEYATNSVSFQQCAKERNLDVIRSGSDAHFQLWLAGFSGFMLQMQGSGIPVYLNKVFWSGSDGAEELYAASYIDPANAYLSRLYNVAEVLGCLPIDYDPAMMRLDKQHKWGLAPFHYNSEVYNHLMACMDASDRQVGSGNAPARHSATK